MSMVTMPGWCNGSAQPFLGSPEEMEWNIRTAAANPPSCGHAYARNNGIQLELPPENWVCEYRGEVVEAGRVLVEVELSEPITVHHVHVFPPVEAR